MLSIAAVLHRAGDETAAVSKKEECGRGGMEGWSEGWIFVMSTSNHGSLLTRMQCIVQWLELEHRLEALARPLGISDELDVETWSRAEYLHFRSLVAEYGYCGRS